MERPAKFVPVEMREIGAVDGPRKAVLDKTFNNHKVPQLTSKSYLTLDDFVAGRAS